MNLHRLYHPITAAPFLANETYTEYEPCEALKPYIRCFWGSRMPYKKRKQNISQQIVVPDTCADIIFKIDFTNNRINGRFCGIDDRTFVTEDNATDDRTSVDAGEESVFAIRFYPWSVFLFSEETLRGTKNGFFDVDRYFSGLKKEIEPLLFEAVRIEERICLAERYLLNHMYHRRDQDIFLTAMSEMLQKKGNIAIGELSKTLPVGVRQLERIFGENIGISPKQLATLIRYQSLWHNMLFLPQFQILDAVCQYGYTDQSHLLRDFKKFHSMGPAEARRYALLCRREETKLF